MNTYGYTEALFKSVLLQSKAVAGRLFVCPRGGSDINADAVGQLALDALANIKAKKYPLVLMMPPRTMIDVSAAQVGWERNRITLFFLRTSFHDNGKTAKPNLATNTSKRTVVEDWDDMKAVATDFLRALDQTIRKNMLQANTFRLVAGERMVSPVTLVGADQVSGVRVDCVCDVNSGCEIADYEDVDLIELPEESGSGGGTGGGTGGGGSTGGGGNVLNADSAGALTEPPAGWVSFSVLFQGNPEDCPIGVSNKGAMLIDFGNGPKAYPDNRFIVKTYSNLAEFTVTIWHNGSLPVVSVSKYNSFASHKNKGISGTLPGGIVTFQMADGLQELPALPNTIKHFQLSSTSLSQETIRTLAANLAAGSATNGTLSIATNPITWADTEDLDALSLRGWTITAWDYGALDLTYRPAKLEDYEDLDFFTLEITEGQAGNTINFTPGFVAFIDFGDGGPVWRTDAQMTINFPTQDSTSLKVWYYPNENRMSFFLRDVTIGAIGGTLPGALEQFDIVRVGSPFTRDGLLDIPALPNTVKRINLQGNTLDAAKVNALIGSLVAAGQTGGTLNLLQVSPPTDAAAIAALTAAGWTITT